MAWSTGGNLSTGRYGLGGAGSSSAAIAFSGTTGSNSVVTEEYNGTSWGAGGNVSTAARYTAGAGSLTAGLKVAGYTTTFVATCEEYDGTSWSAGGDLTTARYAHAAFGTQTAGVAVGGVNALANTEEYDGTSWSAGGNLPVNRDYFSGCGTLTAGLTCGGVANAITDTAQATSHEYDGTSWASGGTLITGRTAHGTSGTQTDGFAIAGTYYSGGVFNNLSSCEKYDGASWASSDSLAAAKRFLAAAQNGGSALAFGGWDGTTYLTTTEKWILTISASSTVTATSSITGAATIIKNVSSTVTSVSSVTGAATIIKNVSSTVTSVSSVTGAATGGLIIITASGSVTAASSVSGNVTYIAACSGSVTAVSTVSGAVQGPPVEASGTVTAQSVVTGAASIISGNICARYVTDFPSSQTVQYRLKDGDGNLITDWTATGVTEIARGDGYSTYRIWDIKRANVIVDWRISGTTYFATEAVNIHESYIDDPISSRIDGTYYTPNRALKLDYLDRANSLSFASSDYTAPDNAGIASNGVAIAAVQADVTSILEIVTLLKKYARNKRIIWKDSGTGIKYLIIYDDNGTTELVRKALKDPTAANIADLAVGSMATEEASSV